MNVKVITDGKKIEYDQNFLDMLDPPPLHKDLVPYIRNDRVLGMRMLRHPLVYSVPYAEAFNKHVNASYEYKVEAAAKALSECDMARYCYIHERPYRLDAIENFLKVWPKYGCDKRTGRKFWQYLAELHTDSENINQNQEEWEALWSYQCEERMRWRGFATDRLDRRKLVGRLTIYHGTSMYAEPDMSWTLNRDIAVWFALRFNKENPIIYTGEANAEDVIAYLTSRGEDEIVIDPCNVEIISDTSDIQRRKA